MLIPTPRLFRSRWAALAWAAAILWTAAQVAGSPPDASGNGAASEQLDTADIAAIANAFGQ